MRILTHFCDFCAVSVRRLVNRKGTTLAAFLGLTLAISLILSVLLYADSIYYLNVSGLENSNFNTLYISFITSIILSINIKCDGS
jgi:hypothetical protein